MPHANARAAIAIAVYRDPSDEHPRAGRTLGKILREMPALARDPRLIAVCGTALRLQSR